MAFAITAVGLSLQEWQSLTPEEWTAVATTYNQAHEQQSHEAWERMRLHATLTIQPHVKGHLTPMRLLPFPWETNHHNEAPAPQLSKEEARAQFVKLMQRERSNTAQK